MVSRMARTANGAEVAISTASSRAAARSSSAGARRSARPIASAASPFTEPPVYMSSSARCWPTTAGSVTEMPNPWWKPRRAKLHEKRVSGVATRKSVASASPSPPPTAAPCTAAIVGTAVPAMRAACE